MATALPDLELNGDGSYSLGEREKDLSGDRFVHRDDSLTLSYQSMTQFINESIHLRIYHSKVLLL